MTLIYAPPRISAVRSVKHSDYKRGMVTPKIMSTEKDNEFLQFILDSTQAGKVQWAPTALNTEFTAGFKGKYKVNIEKRLDRDGDIKYMMTLTNAEDGRDLLALDAYRGKL